MATSFPPELWRLVALDCDKPSLAALSLTATAWAAICEPVLYDAIALRVYGKISQDGKMMACTRTLSTVPRKAALVRSLLVAYVDLVSSADTRSQTRALCTALSKLHRLLDLRIRTDDAWTRDWISFFTGIVEQLASSKFGLQVLHVPSKWIGLPNLDDAVYRHRKSLRAIGICGGGHLPEQLLNNFERLFGQGSGIALFAYENTAYNAPYDVIDLYPFIYLGRTGWTTTYSSNLTASFSDPVPLPAKPWQLSRTGIHALALHFSYRVQLAAVTTLGFLQTLRVESEFPSVRALELNLMCPILVSADDATLDVNDIVAAVKPFTRLKELSLGGWTFEGLGKRQRLAMLLNLERITFPDGSTINQAGDWMGSLSRP